MSLAFLYPLCWLGALAVGAPLWLHLRRRTETSLVRFSAVQFLDDEPQAKRSPIRVRDPLLLLLRLLALLLLVAAFTWPYLASGDATAISESRVYILDNTLSHQADQRFAAAQTRLARELSEAPRETQVAVIELTSLPRVIAEFGDSRETIVEAVERLVPSSQRGSYLAAYRLASTLLSTSLGEKRSIHFRGDSQRNQWTEAAHVAPFLENVELTFPEVDGNALPNVSVFEPRVRRVFLGERVRLECEVKVARQGGIDAAEVELVVNGEEIGNRKLEFDEQSSVIQFEVQWEASPRDWIRGELRVTAPGDSLPEDNRCFFGLAPVQEGRAVVLARSQYVRAALSPEVMAGRWTASVWDEPPWNTSVPPRDADVLCIESRYLVAAEARELAQSYLSRGQGVLLLIDQVGPAIQTFLRDHQIELRSVVDQPAGAANFQYVFADHPIFQPFRSADFGNLLDVQIHRYRRLAIADAIPLAFSQNGDPLLFQVHRPRGTLLVAAFGLERAETNWPLHPTFVPFLDLCLQHARLKSTLPTDALPAERCVWNVPEQRPEAELVLTHASEETIRAPIRNGRVEFQAPAKPGLYSVSLDGGATLSHLLQINAPSEESDLTFEDARETVEAWRLKAESPEKSPLLGQTNLDLTRAEILSQTTWWWLLVAGVLALLAETWWVAMRQTATIPH